MRNIPTPPGFVHRPVDREATRPELRTGEARGRNGEILSRNNRSNDVADQFDLPLHMQEAGWSYQWVRTSCYGKPDPQNVHTHMENGWRPIPSSRWPGYFHPPAHTGSIEREGQILMERPLSLTRQAIEDGVRAARKQHRNQTAAFKGVDQMLDETPGHAAGFEASDEHTDSRGIARPMIKRNVERAPVSSYPSRTLAVGDEI